MTVVDLDLDFGVVIIGRGFAGLTLAVEIARRRLCRVAIVYDKKDKMAATPAAHGLSAIKGILEADSKLFSDKIAGHQGFDVWLRDLEKLIGRKRPKDVWKKGVVESFSTMENFRQQFGRIYRQDFIGAKNVKLSCSDKDSFSTASYPGDFWVDPHYLVEVLSAAAEQLGVVTHIARVQSITPGIQMSTIRLVGETDLHSRHTVISAGVGSYDLIPLRLRDQIPPLFAVGGWTFKSTFDDSVLCEVKGVCGLAAKGGQLFWGSTSEPSAPVADICETPVLVADRESSGTALLKKINPKICHGEGVQAKWGARLRTRSRDPLVQCIDEQGGLWLNCGYYKSGIILSWLYARSLSSEICDKI